MKVIEKFQSAIAEGEAMDWQMLRIQLDAEHAAAQTTRERESLLSLFTVMMDMVERIDTTPETLAAFKEERRHSYHRLLLREATIDGRVCPDTLHGVTAREVLTGRMLQDDRLRLAAIQGYAVLTKGASPEPTGPFGATQPATLSAPSSGERHRVVGWWEACVRRLFTLRSGTPANRAV